MKSFVLNGVRFTKFAREKIQPRGHPFNLCIEFKPDTFCFGKFACSNEYIEIDCIRFFFINKALVECLFMFAKMNKIRNVRNYGAVEFLSSDYSLFKKLKLLE